MNSSSFLRHARVLADVKVQMRDGVNLASTVVLPPGDGPFPVVLVRTAYNRTNLISDEWAQRGLALVVQDCRGRYGSGGEFYTWINEERDGLDTLEWLTAQPWCDGRIGMYGASYLAGVQFPLAVSGHPSLTALNPSFIPGDLQHAYFRDGAFSLALTFSWLCLEVAGRTSTAGMLPIYNVPQLLRHLPLRELDQCSAGAVVPLYRDYVEHETRDDYWRAWDYRATLSQARTPMLFMGGWYDYYAGDAFLDYNASQKSPADSKVAANHRLLIGPWTHGVSASSELGELDFGPEALWENDATERWLECLLKGGTAKEFQEAPIRLFVMGANRWRDEYEWPLKRAKFASYFLHSDGAANSASGNGELSRNSPRDEPPDRYNYNPENPVPTLGGNHSVGPYNPGLYEHALPGPYDQRPVEQRDDVLVYTSSPLEEDIEVTGPVILKLFASSSAPDTDWVARLCDVYPDGRSINITEGVLRARFRDRNWATPRLLEPGQIYEFTIDLQCTSNLFRRGHRIRLDITSSNFPLWDRNLNTGDSIAGGIELQSADQTIYHDAFHPTHLVLPIIPQRD